MKYRWEQDFNGSGWHDASPNHATKFALETLYDQYPNALSFTIDLTPVREGDTQVRCYITYRRILNI